MIYFLDNSFQLQKIVTSKNVISAIHEHELNGLIRADVELDLSYANKFLILGIDHVGYYYKDEFYLHKIQRVEYDHVNETATVVLRHVFFEDMIFGKLIQDVRPQNQDALSVSRQTIDANTRWQTIMTDVTGRLSTNFYWQVPYEVIEFMTENYRIEYLPKILFDGQNINGFQLHLANKIGEDINIRIPYGSRVLDLKYEEDYSEIITKLVVHGKGEEVGDGYGRRINISDVNFSRNGVESPVGSLYLEDETITNTYGNDGQTPREGREVFEDIEDANELAEAGYQHYLQVSRPQMLFTADVADIGDVGIGDSVMIIRREYDAYFKARIHKLSVDLLYPGDAQVELGDYEHFRESKISRKSREKNNRVQGQLSDRITRLKQEADERFDNEVGQWKSEYEQALIDVHAEIEADRENMTNLIEGTRTEFTDNLNAEISQTKEYAEQKAQEKAETVRTDLEIITSGHQAMIDGLKDNVMNIDDFLGDSRSVTLDKLFLESTMNMEERIRNINVNSYNMLQGTRFDEPSKINLTRGGVSLLTSDGRHRIRIQDDTGSVSRFNLEETIKLEANINYYLIIEYRTFTVPEIDYLAIETPNGYIRLNNPVNGLEGFHNLVMDGVWNRATTIINTPQMIQGKLHIGTRHSGAVDGVWIDVRQPYLTNTSNRQWLPHPNDATQSIEMVTRRMTDLEDGLSDYITKSQYNVETGQLDQYIKSVEENVEGNKLILQQVEDWQVTNGQSVLETVDAYERKIWLNDFSEIGANLLPQSSNSWEDGSFWSGGGEATDSTTRMNIRMKESIPLILGERYTLSDYSLYNSNIHNIAIHQWDSNGRYVGLSWVGRGKTRTFTAIGTRLRISMHATSGFVIPTSFIESIDGRIKTKLEKGAASTPIINALSRIEQIADKINMTVVELDGTYLKQTDFQLTPNYWQLGAMRIGAEDVSSVLRGSPDALDAVVSNFNLTGNLNAKGQITSLAVDAIEGNFARLFANQLTANVITSDHIQVGTALVDKMFATSARIDELITKTHFVNEMHALTLNVVDLNASEIRARLLTANTIEADWLKSGTALIDRVFASTAMFERMMAKSGFVTTLNTVTIDTDQLTIRRPDGVAWVTNGVHRFNLSIQRNQFMNPSVSWTGQNYTIPDQFWRTIENMYIYHDSRYLATAFLVSLTDSSSSASAYVHVRVREFTSGNLVGEAKVLAKKGEVASQSITLDMQKPSFTAKQFYLEAKMDEETVSGDGWRNYGLARVNRAVMRG